MSQTRLRIDELLVYGFIHKPLLKPLNIPLEIINLCLKFYMELYEILKFSDDKKKHYICERLQLSEDRTCVSRPGYTECGYVLADIEPVTYGIHCWRIQVNFIKICTN